MSIKSEIMLTLSRALIPIRWSLNVCLIVARVNFRLGIFAPFVACEAISIISRNLGCSRACIGCKIKWLTTYNAWNILLTCLICGDQPLNCSPTKELVCIFNNTLREFLLLKVTVQGSRHLFFCCLPLLDVARQPWLKIVLLRPFVIFSL